jgi:hypothetical protein
MATSNAVITMDDGNLAIAHTFENQTPSIEELFSAFKNLLLGFNYSEESINEYIVDTTKNLIDETFRNL